VQNSRNTGAYFQNALRERLGSHRFVGDVRGEGLMAAVELQRDPDAGTDFDAADKITAQVVGAMAKHGVIARAMPQGEIIGFAPPLCITPAEVDKVADVTAQALEDVTGAL